MHLLYELCELRTQYRAENIYTHMMIYIYRLNLSTFLLKYYIEEHIMHMLCFGLGVEQRDGYAVWEN